MMVILSLCAWLGLSFYVTCPVRNIKSEVWPSGVCVLGGEARGEARMSDVSVLIRPYLRTLCWCMGAIASLPHQPLQM